MKNWLRCIETSHYGNKMKRKRYYASEKKWDWNKDVEFD